MTIDLWVPMAVVAGIAGRLLSRRHGLWIIAPALVVPPALLCLYAVSRGLGVGAFTLAALSAAWAAAAGLAALCTHVWLKAENEPAEKRRAKRRQTFGPWLAVVPGALGTHFISAAYGGPEHTPFPAWAAIAILLAVSLAAAFLLQRRLRREQRESD